MLYTQYNKITGEIMGSGQVSARNASALVYGDLDIIVGASWDLRESYIDPVLLTQVFKTEVPYTINKPSLELIANGVDQLIFSGLPDDITVRIIDVFPPQLIADNTLTLTLDTPGSYKMHMYDSFKYYRTELIIVGT